MMEQIGVYTEMFKKNEVSAIMSEKLISLASAKYNEKETHFCPICKKKLIEGKSATILAVHPACYHNL